VVAKVRETQSMSKQKTHRFHMKWFNIKKLKKAEDREKYHTEISNRATDLENSENDVNINTAWETIKENIKISAKRVLFTYLWS
jgi:hypothetical protein